MLALLQRVSQGKVVINSSIYSEIDYGYVILLGIFQEDSVKDIDTLVEKIVNLRVMADEEGKMNKSILDISGEILVVSQFTLCADVKKGRRPSFIDAMKPAEAEKLYEKFISQLKARSLTVKTGQFGAMMEVEIHNDGPVTIFINSKEI